MATIVAESSRRGSAGASPSRKNTPSVPGETLIWIGSGEPCAHAVPRTVMMVFAIRGEPIPCAHEIRSPSQCLRCFRWSRSIVG